MTKMMKKKMKMETLNRLSHKSNNHMTQIAFPHRISQPTFVSIMLRKAPHDAMFLFLNSCQHTVLLTSSLSFTSSSNRPPLTLLPYPNLTALICTSRSQSPDHVTSTLQAITITMTRCARLLPVQLWVESCQLQPILILC